MMKHLRRQFSRSKLLIVLTITWQKQEPFVASAFTTTSTTWPTPYHWNRPRCGVPSVTTTLTASLESNANTATDQSSTSVVSTTPKKGILYDTPVSNHGARCRLILYKKGIGPEEVLVQPPSVLGGLTSESYRSLNPQGKMPLFVCTNQQQEQQLDSSNIDEIVNIFESDTISRYLLHEYEHVHPSFHPNSVRSNLMVRIHDTYISTIQGCLYKAKPPFGMYHTRIDAIQEFRRQLCILEDLMIPPPSPPPLTNSNHNGPYYLCGKEVTLADATIFPTMVFVSYMFPKFDVEVPKKIHDWYHQLAKYDADFSKIQEEILGTLHNVWDTANHRWETILGAGWRDVAATTIFDQRLAGTIPATVVEQSDDKILAFRDIHPAAPAHILLIPKHRNGLTQLSQATSEHVEILGRLLVAAASLARDESMGFGPDGCRIVINDGPHGGQEVMHLHVHLLGGRPMTWPPG